MSSDVIELCHKNLFKNEETPYVTSYETTCLKVLLTKKSLLRDLQNSTNIHIDGTYKLNIYGFPVIVIGFTDFKQKIFFVLPSVLLRMKTLKLIPGFLNNYY
ncbi:hypothetical protein DMUE_1064 [Dictyocoela muelleri]|nr:hypothetical protein DMUE_1064 [Dictyocoela muelleri]